VTLYHGTASVDPADPLLPGYPRALFVVRVRVRELFPTCPRYIHHYELVERSSYVPRAGTEPPVPDWKLRDWARDVLPEGDAARRDSESAPTSRPKSRSATSP
jgi:hypothetical protein